MSVTEDRLAEIQTRADAASPELAEPREVFGLVAHTQIDGFVFPVERKNAEQRAKANIEFVAAAREDVPWLLALVREQQAKLDAARALHPECEVFVSPHSCREADSGREPDNRYSTGGYCLSCKVRRALDGE
ncbi:hypothetical protein LWF01_02865 [Saxibacter everestensis]|uniref:Uncharacterized protein n=1 Tax=Saxibacter everestensis TaxID=2909229 RepID=A0ABY8QWI3_9MICO|nr:hypothetical protein LWF01_02865 [Brevibacteriaceae bacterium ZFBP1038]